MDFLKSYFFKNEPLFRWTFFHQNWIGGTCKTLQHLISCTASGEIRCCNVLHVPPQSSFDEKKCSTKQRFIHKEANFYKIHTLVSTQILIPSMLYVPSNSENNEKIFFRIPWCVHYCKLLILRICLVLPKGHTTMIFSQPEEDPNLSQLSQSIF